MFDIPLLSRILNFRLGRDPGAHDEREQTLNQILTEWKTSTRPLA